jgi:hypothetical protein
MLADVSTFSRVVDIVSGYTAASFLVTRRWRWCEMGRGIEISDQKALACVLYAEFGI